MTTVQNAAQRADLQGDWKHTAQDSAVWKKNIDTYVERTKETRKRRRIVPSASTRTRSPPASDNEAPAITADDYTIGWDEDLNE